MSILRWIYEELPSDYKDRLQVVYFIHPGLHSRLVFATLGLFLLSGGFYWKLKYVSRLQYLWEDIKDGDVEIPEFVQDHDLEHRPLTDYGIEPDPLNLTAILSTGYPFGKFEERWSSSREFALASTCEPWTGDRHPATAIPNDKVAATPVYIHHAIIIVLNQTKTWFHSYKGSLFSTFKSD